MPEGLGPGELAQEIAEHRKREADRKGATRESEDRRLSIVEAILLSVVSVLVAYSGFAAAKWSTESSIHLAQASSARSKGNRNDLEAIVTRTLDSASFNAWFTAFVAGHKKGEILAERRLRPGYRPAFFAWLATDPIHNPHAPPGPSYMPQYVIPQEAAAKQYDKRADELLTEGSNAGETSDKYVRDTVFLASVLFLVGISVHFSILPARLALVGVGGCVLIFAVIQLLGLPPPP